MLIDIATIIVFVIFILYFLRAFTSAIGFPLGLIVGVLILLITYGGYVLLVGSATTLFDAGTPK